MPRHEPSIINKSSGKVRRKNWCQAVVKQFVAKFALRSFEVEHPVRSYRSNKGFAPWFLIINHTPLRLGKFSRYRSSQSRHVCVPLNVEAEMEWGFLSRNFLIVVFLETVIFYPLSLSSFFSTIFLSSLQKALTKIIRHSAKWVVSNFCQHSTTCDLLVRNVQELFCVCWKSD